MTTDAETSNLNLLALVWLYRDRTQPRRWFRWRTLFGMTHVTVYSDRHTGTDFYTASVTGTKSRGWVLSLHMLDRTGTDIVDTRTITKLGRCGDARAAKKLAVEQLTNRLNSLEAALLAETGMSPAAVRLLAVMCSNDVHLTGRELFGAADVARAAVT